jgi:cytochrome c biogenesis protein CcmG, thiol:disulfide interchange protein DsbE
MRQGSARHARTTGILLLLVAGGLASLTGACARKGCPDPAADPKIQLAKLDFVVKDMAGENVRLADFKGRPIVINFWATWCGPCKEEIPALVQLVDQDTTHRFTVLGVSTDDKPGDLRKFAAEYKMNYPVLVGLGHDDLLEAYDAQVAVPISWVVDACGVVAVKHMGIWTKAEFETAVRKLL